MRIYVPVFTIIGLLILAFVLFVNPLAEPVPQEQRRLPFPLAVANVTDTNYVNGYFFMAPFKMTGNAPKSKGTLMIVDGNGAVVWAKPNLESSNFQLQANGMMTYFSNKKFYIMNNWFKVVDSVECADGAETDAHEFVITANDRRFLIGMRDTVEDHSGFSITEPIKWRGGKKMKIRYNVIQELDKNGNLLYEWSTLGHFRIEDIDPVFLIDTGKLDIPHLNAFNIDESGNFLVTARYTNEVVYVNKKSREPEWIFGGNRSSFTVNDSNYIPFVGMHAAHFLANGNVMLYDNGWALTDKIHPATAYEFALNGKTKTAEVVWSDIYNNKLIAESTGNVQRLENGGTLISFGKIFEATPNLICAVVDPTGKPRFELMLPDTMGTYRTYYYEKLPFKIYSAVMDVEHEERGVYVLRTRGDLEELWSTGQEAAAIEVTKPGFYQWFNRNEDGSYTGSNSILITQEMLNAPIVE